MITAGIDMGAKTIKVVILRDGQVVAKSITSGGLDTKQAAERAVDEALKKAELSFEEIKHTTATGTGRRGVSFAQAEISDVSADAKGAVFLFPNGRTVIDVGAEEGRGMEVFADLLAVPIEEIGGRSLDVDEEPPAVSSTCVVFAKSEATGLLREGWPKNKVLAAYCSAMAHRVVTLLERLGVEKDFAITGGTSKNKGVMRRIERELGIKALTTDYDPQIAGALGAALFAEVLVKKGRKT